MFSATDMCGKRAQAWNTVLTSRSCGAVRETSIPPSSIRPPSGRSKPAIRRSVVVLPEPEGPSSVKNSPRRTSRSMLSTAITPPYALRTPASRMSSSRAATAATGSAGASAAMVERLLEDVEPAAELVVGRDERREDPDHVPVEPAREQHEPALPRRRGDRVRERRGLLGELHREHRAASAHLGNRGMLDGVETGTDQLPARRSSLLEGVARDLVEHDRRRCARAVGPAEGASEPAGADGIHQLASPCHGREREAPTERLSRDKQVRLDTGVVDRPHASGPPDAALDLVGDEDDPVLVADAPQRRQELGR